jgi:hypothetical protein
LDPEEDEFNYFATPTKPKLPLPRAPSPEEKLYDWEDSDDEYYFNKKHIGRDRHVSPVKRPRFDDIDPMADIDFAPPPSPVHKKPMLADPFMTPPKQITSTPYTPPETRLAPATTLNTLSYSLLQQLSPHSPTLGKPLFQSLRDHLFRCGRVAEGAVKGRDAARTANNKNLIRVDELERRVRILEAEREVDRAVIGALKRNVDVLTGKVRRTD